MAYLSKKAYEGKAEWAAKRYNGKVSNAAIQEVHSGISYYGCSRGIVVTNSYFTKNAINLAEKYNIKLIDRNDIMKWRS